MEHCFVCQKENPKICSHCHSISYCSKECQKKDWKRHKIECNSNITVQQIQGNGGIKTKITPFNISLQPENYSSADLNSSEASFICTEIPGKGEGLVATRNIEYGELIIRERPIMETGPLPLQKESDLKKIFNKLTADDQETILSMHDAHATIEGEKTLKGIVNTNSLARLVYLSQKHKCGRNIIRLLRLNLDYFGLFLFLFK